MMYGNYGYYGGEYFPFHIFGIILMVLFWILVISLIFRLLRGGRRDGHWRGWYRDRDDREYRLSHDTALDILKERYAKGEITKAQFEEMKKDVE